MMREEHAKDGTEDRTRFRFLEIQETDDAGNQTMTESGDEGVQPEQGEEHDHDIDHGREKRDAGQGAFEDAIHNGGLVTRGVAVRGVLEGLQRGLRAHGGGTADAKPGLGIKTNFASDDAIDARDDTSGLLSIHRIREQKRHGHKPEEPTDEQEQGLDEGDGEHPTSLGDVVSSTFIDSNTKANSFVEIEACDGIHSNHDHQNGTERLKMGTLSRGGGHENSRKGAAFGDTAALA